MTSYKKTQEKVYYFPWIIVPLFSLHVLMFYIKNFLMSKN